MTCRAFEEIRTPEFQNKLHRIMTLLEAAYKHYFANSDGHCKLMEGHVSIELPPFFWQSPDGNARPRISIYSYVLGPGRAHGFENVDLALREVEQWHAAEMAATHDGGFW